MKEGRKEGWKDERMNEENEEWINEGRIWRMNEWRKNMKNEWMKKGKIWRKDEWMKEEYEK